MDEKFAIDIKSCGAIRIGTDLDNITFEVDSSHTDDDGTLSNHSYVYLTIAEASKLVAGLIAIIDCAKINSD